MKSRLALLEQYYTEDPGDPFNIYALALEYRRDHPTKTTTLFNILLERHPTYIPVYYQAGILMMETGESERAKEVILNGIAAARIAGDQKALNELKSLLDELGGY